MHRRNILLISLSLAFASPTIAAQWGEFRGTVRTEWLSDGRNMRLLSDFEYVDPIGTTWPAPTGTKIDGASIPQVFWSFIGGPFEGKYRSASVVHDYACQVRNRSWRLVHQMFYAACRAGGVSELSSKVMYGAVYHFGPRWADDAVRLLRDDADFLRMREYITRNSKITLDAIEELTSNFLRELVRELPPPRRIPAS